MENNIAIWRVGLAGEPLLEKIHQEPVPTSLDDATRHLPGGGYTTFRTYDHFRVLRLQNHFNRLEETARLAGITVRLDRERAAQALHQALSMYPAREMRVRIVLDLVSHPGGMYLLVETLHMPERSDYVDGVRVVTRSMHRSNPKAKLTEFIETAAAVRQEIPSGVNEAVMVGEDGRLLEGLSSNFFAIKDGAIWTAEKGVLSGITRSLVLDVIRHAGIPLQLEGVRFDEINTIEEAFITSASRAVLPVTEMDGLPVGNGLPGPVTKRLMRGYEQRLEEELVSIG